MVSITVQPSFTERLRWCTQLYTLKKIWRWKCHDGVSFNPPVHEATGAVYSTAGHMHMRVNERANAGKKWEGETFKDIHCLVSGELVLYKLKWAITTTHQKFTHTYTGSLQASTIFTQTTTWKNMPKNPFYIYFISITCIFIHIHIIISPRYTCVNIVNNGMMNYYN